MMIAFAIVVAFVADDCLGHSFEESHVLWTVLQDRLGGDKWWCRELLFLEECSDGFGRLKRPCQRRKNAGARLDTTGETRACMALAKGQNDTPLKHLPLGATVSGCGGGAGVEIGVYTFLALIMLARSEKLSR